MVPSTWNGRETSFALEARDDPTFSLRLALPASAAGHWIVLRYRCDVRRRPLRPMVRFLRRRGGTEHNVLPGVALDVAHWLGWLPTDLEELRIAAEPGFVLERVGLRSEASVLAECLGRHPLRAGAALYNRLRGRERRYRDIVRACCAATPISSYPDWKAARLDGTAGATPPSDLTIRLILPTDDADPARIAQTIDSLRAQTHKAWQLRLAGSTPPEIDRSDPRLLPMIWDATAPAAALLAEADGLGFLQPGDRLAPDALAILADRLADADAPELVYADEEVCSGRPRPRLKPDWSPDFALVTGYPGAPTLIACALIARFGDQPVGPADGAACALLAFSRATKVVHVPRILCTRAAAPTAEPDRAALLERHLRESGSPARIVSCDGVTDLVWPVPEPRPLVSVIVPSRDRLDLIGRLADGVLTGTAYAPLELVIVDNGSTDPAVLALYERLRADPRVRILPYPDAFDFSAMSNAGARLARGSVLVLLNNDIAVLRPDWLDALVGQALRPDVGAVGAKLLYADGSLQHAGVVVGLGGRAGHILRRRPADSPGHLDRLRVAHEVSAVTAACLAVERRKFEAVGGLDAACFPIDFNDVDLCLRLSAAGWKTMWTPRAVLSHLESVSRGPSVGAKRRRFESEADAFAERWRHVIRHDPYYHPALSLTTFGEDLE